MESEVRLERIECGDKYMQKKRSDDFMNNKVRSTRIKLYDNYAEEKIV